MQNRLLQRQNFNVLELNFVRMPRKPNVTARTILARVRGVGHELGDLAQIGIENGGSVQFNGYFGALNADGLVIPLTGRSQIPSLRRYHPVRAAMRLAWIDGLVILVAIIEHLQFAHPDISTIGIALVLLSTFLFGWITHCQAIVPSGR